MKEGIYEILGKRISGIIVKKAEESQPRSQLFLLFDDNTYYEMYSYSEIIGTSGLASGDRKNVLNYFQSSDRFIELDGYLDENGQVVKK